MITPVKTQVSSTPKVANVIPGAKTDLISLNLVSMPPVNRMILIAIVLMAWAFSTSISMPRPLPKTDAMPDEPKNIPTTKNSSRAGTPYLYPILSAKILTKNRRDNINRKNSTCTFYLSFFPFPNRNSSIISTIFSLG